MDDPEKLIDHVIAYLKEQQRMFGDFETGTSNVAEPEKTTPDKGQHSSPSVDTPDAPKSEPNRPPPDNDSPAPQPDEESMQNSGKETIGGKKPQSHLFSTNPDASDNIYDQVEGCQTLKELYEISKKAEVLKTDLEGTNLVFGVGNPDADLVLIGEAPGSEEDKLGEPFVGKAGQLLNKILKAIDLDRDDIYIANILKHRPPKNRNPLPDERKRSLPFLLKQLDLIQPKLILCLGKVAANTLLDNKESLKNMRGTFHAFMDRYEMMVTYHPAACLRNANYKRPTWEDVKKLRKRYDELGCKPS